MKNRLNIKQLQKEIGIKIKEELSKKFMRVDIGFVNLDYKDGKGYVFYIYNFEDIYSYMKINVNFVQDAKVEDYVKFILDCIDKNKNLEIHEATPEERYIIQILEQTGVHDIYIFDGCLCNTKNDNEIDLSCVDELKYSRIESKIEIVVDDEEFLVDLAQEEIVWTNEPDYDKESEEIIDNNFMYRLCNKWNQIKGIWCNLLYSDKDECLMLKDLETGNINVLVGLDDINYIKFNKKENKIYVEYDKDNYGFTGFGLSTIGIEY